MPRARPDDRIDELIAAARATFTERGYRRTRMGDVADRMGVAHGTVYTYVASKDALLHLVVERLCRPTAASPSLPVPTPPPGETVALLTRGVAGLFARPVLRAALAAEQPDDVRAELAAIVVERYHELKAGRHVLALVEKLASDLPEVSEMYFARGRRGFHADLAKYVDARVKSGAIRRVADVEISARFVNESITWFAWGRFGDPTGKRFDEDAVLATLTDLITSALIDDRR